MKIDRTVYTGRPADRRSQVEEEVYDRLGLEDQYMEILGVKIPMNTIPITPGRNLAVILEVAAMNNRQRKMGYNPALEFTDQINRHFEQDMGKSS